MFKPTAVCTSTCIINVLLNYYDKAYWLCRYAICIFRCKNISVCYKLQLCPVVIQILLVRKIWHIIVVHIVIVNEQFNKLRHSNLTKKLNPPLSSIISIIISIKIKFKKLTFRHQ